MCRNTCSCLFAHISAGANAALKDDAGRTPLHRAAENHHTKVIQILYNHGVYMNEQDKRGWSALFQPVACNDIEVVTQLLQLGIDPNLGDINGETALHIIANRLRAQNILVLCRTDVNVYTRHLAVFNGAVQTAQQTLGNDLAIASLLINYGANVNKKSLWQESPAFVAAEEGYGAIIKLLYESGADVANESWVQEQNWPAKLSDNREICEWLRSHVFNRVRSLQEICKFTIRCSVQKDINSRCHMLPLPQKLVDFLQIE